MIITKTGTIIIATIVMAAMILSVSFVFNYDNYSKHKIFVVTDSGKKIDVSNRLLSISYHNKNITKIIYQISPDIDTSNYVPYFNTPLGKKLLLKQNYSHLYDYHENYWEINPFYLINYTLPDGTYTITLIPDGIADLEPIEFKLRIEDNRAISIAF